MSFSRPADAVKSAMNEKGSILQMLGYLARENLLAPNAADPDTYKWAERGVRLTRLILQLRASGGKITGAEYDVALTVAVRILGLSNWPQGILSVSRIAEHLGLTEKSVRDALVRLEGLRIVCTKKVGRKIKGIELHREVFCGLNSASSDSDRPEPRK